MKERNNFKKKAAFHVTKVLWHLDIFRRSFRELSGHACMADSCIFCALKDLFGQLQFSHERALPPDALRKALAQSFFDQHRFQLGFMDDAAECFENILLRIHFHIASNEAEDMCNAKHCIPHQKFAMTLVEQSVCGVCHATSEPLPFTQMVHYVSASALISQSKQFVGASHPDLFGQLLKKAGGMGDIRDCPSSCGAKIQIRRTLINRPEIVSVGIVWDSDKPSLEQIMSLLDTLRVHLRLSDVFHGTFNENGDDNVYHQLVGVVTYYGKHYSTFFYHTKLGVWVYFDDANVREVGPHWEDVVEKCRRGRYQPLLLLFAVPNGRPVDASQAPKSVTLVDKPIADLCNGRHDMSKSSLQRGSLSPTGSMAMGGRRSVTPSPEKSLVNGEDTLSHHRRALTPKLEQSAGQINGKSALPNNEYQNLANYQETIFNRSPMCDQRATAMAAATMAANRRLDPAEKTGFTVRRNDLVRRDSGNWSGDRNSASSSSSTSLENPYHYIIGKMHSRSYNGIPRSPNKNGDGSSGSGNSSGGPADPGYDSFSLSSTDSLPIQQNLKCNFQLAQIPETHQTPTNSIVNRHFVDENSRVADDCERLCAEVDQLLDRSEQAEDLITALSLCNAAVNKARAAMDAPYSNPQTASFATMKHNACVLRARSLHRKLEEPLHNNLKYGETRHSREGSGCSNRGSTGSHSRQNSKDKGNHISHSRQNSQELVLEPTPPASTPATVAKLTMPAAELVHKSFPTTVSAKDVTSAPSKNIEIYATLPKNKKGLLSRSSPKMKNNVIEDEEYCINERRGRSLLTGRSKASPTKKEIEKRARSEERATGKTSSAKDSATFVATTEKEAKKQGKQEEKQNKKQHKIRRKLLMGGLMRRKNRSMPDLREDDDVATVNGGGSSSIKQKLSKCAVAKELSKDDSMVDTKTPIQSNLSGYLSEGNLEYAGNPNLERSKLMRKSFHGSKLMPLNKVPPPPPLRTVSQLSKHKGDTSPPCASPVATTAAQHNTDTVVYANQSSWYRESSSLPYLPQRQNGYEDQQRINTNGESVTYSKGGYLIQQQRQPTANMVVTEAQIHREAANQSLQNNNNEGVDEPDFAHNFPTTSTSNANTDVNFQLPPYPSPIHSTVHSRQASEEFPPPPPLDDVELAYSLREKCEKLTTIGNSVDTAAAPDSGNGWLKELQAKQVKQNVYEQPPSVAETTAKNVKDLKLRFEQHQQLEPTHQTSQQTSLLKSSTNFAESSNDGKTKRKNGKKKNVTFCEQVVLVATADDNEADGYIPNPILERVLRTVLHKESTTSSDGSAKEHTIHSVVPLKRTDSWRLSQGLPLRPFKEPENESNTSQTESQKISEAVDEVDAPTSTPMQRSPLCNFVPNGQTYSPNYIPASSLCLPNNEQDQPPPVPQHQDSVRYLPPNSNNGFHSTSTYSSAPASSSSSSLFTSPSYQNCNSSSSYQPMSLQYYLPSSQATKTNLPPQVPTSVYHHVTESVPKTNISHTLSLSRQNSNASYYGKQQHQLSPSQEPQRTPILPRSAHSSHSSYSAPSKVANGSPHMYHESVKNGHNGQYQQQQYLYSNGTTNTCGNQQQYSYINGSSSNATTGQQQQLHYTNQNYQQNSPQYTNGSQQQPSYHLANNGQHTQYQPSVSPQYGHHQNGIPSHTNGMSQPSRNSMPPNGQTNANGYETHLRNPYQHIPYNSAAIQQQQYATKPPQYSNGNCMPPVYQHPPPPPPVVSTANGPVKNFYQRVPTPVMQQRVNHGGGNDVYTTTNKAPLPIPVPQKYTNGSPYQPVPMPKGGQQSNVIKSMNSNGVVPCNLCRKNQISPPSVYCNDCDFYISRFKQKS